MTSRQSVLVVGPAWVGDMVMAQSLYKTIKLLAPETEIDVIAPAWSAPILSRMPEVRRAIIQPLSHGKLGLLTRYRIGRQLKQEKYQRAFVIPRSLKAALIPYFAHVPKRTGYRGEMRYGLLNDIRSLNKSTLKQTVQRYVALAHSEINQSVPTVPHPQLEINDENRQALQDRLGIHTEKPVIGLLPGAEYGPAKQWPIQNFSELAKRLQENGFVVWVLGSEKDKVLANKIVGTSNDNIINLCGKTRLEDAIDVLSLTSAVVTNDSGLMHVAAAVNRPILAIYGSSTPSYTPPLSNKATVIYKNLECSPCFKRECPLNHTNCLNFVSVSEVFQGVSALLVKYHNIKTLQ